MLPNLVPVQYQGIPGDVKSRLNSEKWISKSAECGNFPSASLGEKFGQLHNSSFEKCLIKVFRWKMNFMQKTAMIVTNPVLPVKYLALSRKPNAQCNACFGSPRSRAALFFKTKTAKLKWYFSVNSKPLVKIDSFEIWKWLGLFDVEDQIMAFCPIPRNKKVKPSWKMFAT